MAPGNIGSSFFILLIFDRRISLSIAEIVRASGADYARMVEKISPTTPVLALPWAAGGWHFSNVPGLATKPKEINRQAAVIGYLSAFVMITVAGLGLLFAVNVRRRRSPLARA